MSKIGKLRNLAPARAAVGAADKVSNPARRWLERRFAAQLLLRTIKEMAADDATHMAAGVSYYALFSIFPLLLFLIGVLGLVLEPAEIRARLMETAAAYFPGSRQLIENNLDAVSQAQGAIGIFGVLGLLWSGSAVFGAVSRSINRAWDVHNDRPFIINKPQQLAMAAGVGLLFLVSLSAATAARALEFFIDAELSAALFSGFNEVASGTLQIISLGLTAGMFLLMYKFIPNTKTYWRYIWPGAISGAIFFELAKNLFVIYLTRFARFEDVYGALTPVIALALWSYINGLILIFGAELSSEYGRLRQGKSRGVLLTDPNSTLAPDPKATPEASSATTEA